MLLKDLPDSLLLKQCRNGDEAAFNILFKRYFNDLLQFAASRLRDDALAEELVMDLMLKLWEKKENDIEIRQLDQYLFRSIRNAIISHWRKKALSLSSLENVPESCTPLSVAADDTMLYTETEALYHDQLQLLSPQRRKVYIMSREDNLSQEAIAEATNLSVNTVKNHIKASLAFLRKNLKDAFETSLVVLICLFY